MDLTEAAALLAALGSGLACGTGGFLLGLRICGPRWQTAWTERHPVELAEDLRAGRLGMRELAPHTQRLVARELEALNTNRPEVAAGVPLVLDGVGHRYAHLSSEALDRLSEQRTPAHRRVHRAPTVVVDAELVDEPDDQRAA